MDEKPDKIYEVYVTLKSMLIHATFCATNFEAKIILSHICCKSVMMKIMRKSLRKTVYMNNFK